MKPAERHIWSKNTTICNFDKALRELAERYGHTYIDLHSLYLKGGQMNPDLTVDGLHLKPEAYQFWYDALEPYV